MTENISAQSAVLSIDGGGIKGIVPAAILAYLENRIRETRPDYHLYQSFDLVGGTSTGGIIALGLICPKPGADGAASGEPYLAEDLLNLYREHGGGIFNLNLWQRAMSADGILDEVYDVGYLEKQFVAYFGNRRLSELLRPSLIPSYDTFMRRGVFFNSEDGRDNDRTDFLVRDVARATSAAPTYFEAARVVPLKGEREMPLIDGGVFANNPALCSLVETSKLLSKRAAAAGKPYLLDMHRIFTLSISTGLNSRNVQQWPWEEVKDFGKLEWIQPLIDVMMSASSETIHYQIKTIYDCTDAAENYVRLAPDLRRASADMDDATPENLEALLADVNTYIADKKKDLDRLAEGLARLAADKAVPDASSAQNAAASGM